VKIHRLLSWAALGICALPLFAQTAKVMTPEDIFRRNTEPRDQTNKPFPPHKVIGNIYFVGSQTLASFLIVTPQGNILSNSCYEETVPALLSRSWVSDSQIPRSCWVATLTRTTCRVTRWSKN